MSESCAINPPLLSALTIPTRQCWRSFLEYLTQSRSSGGGSNICPLKGNARENKAKISALESACDPLIKAFKPRLRSTKVKLGRAGMSSLNPALFGPVTGRWFVLNTIIPAWWAVSPFGLSLPMCDTELSSLFLSSPVLNGINGRVGKHTWLAVQDLCYVSICHDVLSRQPAARPLQLFFLLRRRLPQPF